MGITRVGDNLQTVSSLKKEIALFVRERGWGKFHTPKNLSMSIAIEAAELMEHYQWESSGRNNSKKKNIEHEVADIAAYLLSFCNALNIDLTRAVLNKLKINRKKYPSKLVKGKSHKYSYYNKKSRGEN